MLRARRLRTWGVGIAVAAIVLSLSAVAAPPASAHGGAIGLSLLANNASGPLQSYLSVHAVWVGDGDDADGLSISVQGSGPGSTGGSLSGGGGVYSGTIGYPAGGSWTLTVNVVGAPYEYSASPLVVGVTVEGATAPPTEAPTPAPTQTPTPTAANGTTTTAAPTTTPGQQAPAPTTGATADTGPIIVVPKSVARGSYSVVTFSVPNARTDASVVAVEARFPAGSPLLSAQTKATAGWPASINTVKLDPPRGNLTERVGSVTWVAATTPLKPGEMQLYTVSIGPFPAKGSSMRVTFVQTYSDGTQLVWDAKPTKANRRPAHQSARIRLVKQQASGGAPGSH